jgi:hypothetical protein
MELIKALAGFAAAGSGVFIIHLGISKIPRLFSKKPKEPCCK